MAISRKPLPSSTLDSVADMAAEFLFLGFYFWVLFLDHLNSPERFAQNGRLRYAVQDHQQRIHQALICTFLWNLH